MKSYQKKDVVITDHAEIQAMVRQIDLEDVKENLVNPKRLVYVERQESMKSYGEIYNCYFAYEKHLAHRYILTINRKIIIVTIIKINRDWQRIIEKK